MHERHAIDVPQDAAREPFIRNTTENGERSIEKKPWCQRAPASATRGQNTQDFLLLASSLLLLKPRAVANKLVLYLWPCISLTVPLPHALLTAAHSRLRRSWPLTERLRRSSTARLRRDAIIPSHCLMSQGLLLNTQSAVIREYKDMQHLEAVADWRSLSV